MGKIRPYNKEEHHYIVHMDIVGPKRNMKNYKISESKHLQYMPKTASMKETVLVGSTGYRMNNFRVPDERGQKILNALNQEMISLLEKEQAIIDDLFLEWDLAQPENFGSK